MLQFANTRSHTDAYIAHCKTLGVRPHPARMAPDVVDFFVRLLTEPGDLVLDIFAGSNTTGAVADQLGRDWLGIERDPDYAAASEGRFLTPPSQPDATATEPEQMSMDIRYDDGTTS